MKKFIILILAITALFILANCTNNQSNNSNKISDSNSEIETQYTVTFFDSNIKLKEIKVDKFSTIDQSYIPEVKKEGYSFNGWYVKDILCNESKWLFSMYTVNQDISLYTKYSPLLYTIYFDPGDSVGEMLPQQVHYNDTINTPTCLYKKDYYHFLGWTDSKDSNEIKLKPNNTFVYQYTQDITLYPVWDYVFQLVKNESTNEYTLNNIKYQINSSVLTIPESVDDIPITSVKLNTPNINYVEEIKFSKYVQNIDSWYGSQNLKSLQKIYVDDKNPTYKSIDGVLYIKLSEKSLLLEFCPRYLQLTEFKTPQNVNSINELAFFANKTIKKVFLSSDVIYISGRSFYNSKIEEIEFECTDSWYIITSPSDIKVDVSNAIYNAKTLNKTLNDWQRKI